MPGTPSQKFTQFGKYRDLLLAIALFLVLDLGVLVFNFHTSKQIEADTALINNAAELRMYSQQLTKSLLTLEAETRSELPIQTSMAQLIQARAAFNAALKTLQETLEQSSPLPLIENPQDLAAGLALIDQVEKIWRPIDHEIKPLLGPETPALELVELATTKAVARNIRLMQDADDLVHHLENLALGKSRFMRSIQLAAILLATLNFLFIVFKFLRRLSISDRIADNARRETRQILETVHEGLFLLDRDWRIGGQRSASLDALFSRPIRQGDDFRRILNALFSASDANAAEQFIEVLFNRKVKPALLEQLNPLQEIQVAGTPGRRGHRYLSFSFSQVRAANGEIDALLLTVFDISHKVHLQHELSAAQERAKNDVELLLGVLDHDPRDVKGFIDAALRRIDAINGELEKAGGNSLDYREMIRRVLRTVHGIKGEAAALGTTTVERQAHQFENRIQPLGKKENLAGDDLIPVAVEMKALLDQLLRVDAVIERVLRFANGADDGTDGRVRLKNMLAQAESLALRIAADLNKKIRLEIAAPGVSTIPEPQGRLLAETLPQLVRNAVVHGIETRDERTRQGKSETGTIRIEFNLKEDGALMVSVRDDGCGLSPQQLRRDIVANGFLSAEQVDRMNDNQIIATIFEPGFSSRDTVDMHGGRGEGLALVRDLLARAGGRMKIFSQPNAYTQFLFQLRPLPKGAA